jgi:hypothetical protein
LLTFLSSCLVLTKLKIVLPRFSRFHRRATGSTPDFSEALTLGLVFGLFCYHLAVLPACISIALLIGAFTIWPTAVSVESISWGSSDFRSPSSIRWEEVDGVDCTTTPQGNIMDLTLSAGNRGVLVTYTTTIDLGTLRSVMQSQAPPGAIHPGKLFYSMSPQSPAIDHRLGPQSNSPRKVVEL